jgi:hypothetical protein
MTMNDFLKMLKRIKNQGYLTQQQYRTIRGQILSGDIDGARIGLSRILKEKGVID